METKKFKIRSISEIEDIKFLYIDFKNYVCLHDHDLQSLILGINGVIKVEECEENCYKLRIFYGELYKYKEVYKDLLNLLLENGFEEYL